MNIIVTGANGQLGMCIRDCVKWSGNEDNKYFFYGHKELNIADEDNINEVFAEVKPDVVINCAGYTNVDGAEDPKNYVKAAEANADGPRYLAEHCDLYDATLIHISTDYVYNGHSDKPYKEPETLEGIKYTYPLSYYGTTKMFGDYAVASYANGIIIRTSWLYSEYGKNLYRTFLDKVKRREDIMALSNRLSCPTYARNLASFIVNTIIEGGWIDKAESYGVFNYCNEGVASIYDFALAIETLYESYYKNYEPLRSDKSWTVEFDMVPKYLVQPIKEYKAKAERPDYSVLDCTKVKETFGVKINGWIASLIQCMQNDGAIKMR